MVQGQRADRPGGLVNDGLTTDCANNGGTTWTYNQGVIIGGLVVLHEITGDGTYLRQAEAIAAAALRDLTVPPGILAEPGERDGADHGGDQPQFKGIFVRNLYELYRHSPRAEYRDFILANATSLWRNSRNRRNQIGLAWNGPFDRADAARQGSALDALNAAVGVTEPRAGKTDHSGLVPDHQGRHWDRSAKDLITPNGPGAPPAHASEPTGAGARPRCSTNPARAAGSGRTGERVTIGRPVHPPGGLRRRRPGLRDVPESRSRPSPRRRPEVARCPGRLPGTDLTIGGTRRGRYWPVGA